ncbi:hypothetical protein GCM10017744_051120 [Streptomyces antimycoticus]|uniref:Uncharacterized protein n=1 Tax=Streptomyces antimycoticus TaxID=68175 RepID=A0A4D4K5J0_9ACTN|nr:hypothetical protein SANT12839_051170 [Streptomyces antimycoticus]
MPPDSLRPEAGRECRGGLVTHAFLPPMTLPRLSHAGSVACGNAWDLAGAIGQKALFDERGHGRAGDRLRPRPHGTDAVRTGRSVRPVPDRSGRRPRADRPAALLDRDITE